MGRLEQGENSQPTLSRRIFEVAQHSPGKLAIVCSDGDCMTYSALLCRCAQIVQALQHAGVHRGCHVAVHCLPGSDMICTLLSIMFLGAIYIPLDTRHPEEYLRKIVCDSKPDIVLMQTATNDKTCLVAPTVKHINLASIVISEPPPFYDHSQASDPAFVLYTSGTTGAPKGCILTHENFANQVESLTQTYGLYEETTLQQSALSFDVSLEQIFCALANGGRVAVATQDIRCDSRSIAEFMYAQSVTFTVGVPSEYAALLGHGMEHLKRCSAWKYAICGGERMTKALANLFTKLELPLLMLLNCYGPTEVSLASNFGVVEYRDFRDDAESGSAIGRTLPNYSVYICDDNLDLLPTERSGQICIGGKSVFQGYLHQPRITEMVLKRDEFASDTQRHRGWDTMYCTGDRGYLRADGVLVFEGRIASDSQVKLRGNRIELEHVERAICEASCGRVSQALASVRGKEFESSADMILLAFAVVEDMVDEAEENVFLASLLERLPIPDQMRPSAIFAIKEIPRTVHGKKDRRAASGLSVPKALSEYHSEETARLTVTERRLVTLWRAALSQSLLSKRVDRSADFFRVGGNSLLVVRLQALVEREFGVYIRVGDLFRNSSIAQMARMVETGHSVVAEPSKRDWNSELLAQTKQLQTVKQRQKRRTGNSRKKYIILTGATGFLGHTTLQYLVEDPAVHRVVCIATRRAQGVRIARVPVRSAKIATMAGDLNEIRLGLDSIVWNKIMSRAWAIIHVGAEVSFLKSHESLCGPNVRSVVELLKAAIEFGIPFHFVSTAGLSALTSPTSLPKRSLRAYLPENVNGYISTKWLAEQVIEHATLNHGLTATVHRPSSITGLNYPRQDVLNNVLHTSIDIQAVPPLAKCNGFFNLVDVHQVASDLTGAVLTDDWPAALKFYHHCNETNIEPSKIKSWLEARISCSARTLEWSAWLLEARDAGLDDAVHAYLSSHGGVAMTGLTVASKVEP